MLLIDPKSAAPVKAFIDGLNDIILDLEDEKEGHYKIVLRLKDEEENLIVLKVDEAGKKQDNVASKSDQNGG